MKTLLVVAHPRRESLTFAAAAAFAAAYAKRGYDAAMRTQLEVGVLGFCGVPERRLELLFGATEGAAEARAVLARAAALGAEFAARG